MKKIFLYSILIVTVTIMSGCSGTIKHMNPAPQGTKIEKPDMNVAQVVFLRPQTLGFAIQSAVFEIDKETRKIVGIVPAKAKVSYQTTPGDHVFMVLGESADFMYATLEGGKTYYVLVRPRMGIWKARFSLDPVHKDEVTAEKLQAWLDACQLVEISEDTDKWVNENNEDIAETHKEYYEDWMDKSVEERPKLEAEDGL